MQLAGYGILPVKSIWKVPVTLTLPFCINKTIINYWLFFLHHTIYLLATPGNL